MELLYAIVVAEAVIIGLLFHRIDKNESNIENLKIIDVYIEKRLKKIEQSHD